MEGNSVQNEQEQGQECCDKQENLIAKSNGLRNVIQNIGEEVKSLKKHPNLNPVEAEDTKADFGECMANIMLAYRHLEDARMRLGKVIQAYEGGVSILDHPKVSAIVEEIRK